MIIVLLLFSPFSARFQVQLNERGSLEHVIVHSLRVDRSRLSCSPLLNYDHSRYFEFRSSGTKIQSRKPMYPGFDDTEQQGIGNPGVSPCEGRRTRPMCEDSARLRDCPLDCTLGLIAFSVA